MRAAIASLAAVMQTTPADDVRFITWAQETGFTDNFWSKQVEEAWAVIWPEQLGTTEFEQGINFNSAGGGLSSTHRQGFTNTSCSHSCAGPKSEFNPTPAPAPGCVLGAVN